MSEYDPDFPRRPADELRRIASYHRWLVAVILAQLTLWGGVVVLGLFTGYASFGYGRFPMILTVILGGVGGIYVLMLYWIIRGPILAVIMGLATVIPVFGLLVIVAVNGAATKVLRDHGIPVGFLGGASDADIEDDRPVYDDPDAGW